MVVYLEDGYSVIIDCGEVKLLKAYREDASHNSLYVKNNFVVKMLTEKLIEFAEENKKLLIEVNNEVCDLEKNLSFLQDEYGNLESDFDDYKTDLENIVDNSEFEFVELKENKKNVDLEVYTETLEELIDNVFKKIKRV